MPSGTLRDRTPSPLPHYTHQELIVTLSAVLAFPINKKEREGTLLFINWKGPRKKIPALAAPY